MLQPLLDAIAQQQQRLARFAPPSSTAAWLTEQPKREAAEQELRRLLEQLGAAVADGVRDGTLTITPTSKPTTKPASKPAVAPPVVAPVVAPGPPAKPATKAQREAFANNFGEQRAVTATKSASTEELRLAAQHVERTLKRLGDAPKGKASRKQCNHHLKRAQGVVMNELSKWPQLEPRIHHLLLSALAARLRAIQDDLGRKAHDGTSDVSRAIVAVTRHTQEHRPGIVHGLARDHGPHRPTWWEDAKAHEAELRAHFALGSDAPEPPAFNADDELRRLGEFAKKRDVSAPTEWIARMIGNGVSPRDKRLVNACRDWVKALRGAELKELVRAIEEEFRATEEAAEQEETDGWAHIGLTRGTKAVIVGGQPRQQRIPPLREAFQFAALTWADDPGESSRKVDAIVAKLGNGTVDFVIVITGLIQHRVTEKLSPRLFPGQVITSDGYGVEQIRQALERFLAYPGDA